MRRVSHDRAHPMSKRSTKAAIRRLPALRASLLWHRLEVVRELRRRAAEASSPRLRAVYAAKAHKVARADLASLRVSYMTERVNEICSARRFELTRAVPGIVWMRVQGTNCA